MPYSIISYYIVVKVLAVLTDDSCRCDHILGNCYSTKGQETTTNPTYGMFVRFTLTPRSIAKAKKSDNLHVTYRRYGEEYKQGQTQIAAGVNISNVDDNSDTTIIIMFIMFYLYYLPPTRGAGAGSGGPTWGVYVPGASCQCNMYIYIYRGYIRVYIYIYI